MNENIDLTEILKDVPKGTIFWCTLFGEVSFNLIQPHNGRINIQVDKIYDVNIKPNGTYFEKERYPDAELVLFPSKEQRDWAKFKIITDFKEGEPIMCYNDIDGWVLRTATGVNDDVYGRKRDYSFIEKIRVSEFDFQKQCKKK